jgi:hypothetical protein
VVRRGLAASLFHGIAASPSFCPFSSDRVSGGCLASCQRQQKKRSHTIPTLPWAIADCAFSRQRKIVYKYQRPSVVNSLLPAESDITTCSLAYSLSGDIVNTFLSPS